MFVGCERGKITWKHWKIEMWIFSEEFYVLVDCQDLVGGLNRSSPIAVKILKLVFGLIIFLRITRSFFRNVIKVVIPKISILCVIYHVQEFIKLRSCEEPIAKSAKEMGKVQSRWIVIKLYVLLIINIISYFSWDTSPIVTTTLHFPSISLYVPALLYHPVFGVIGTKLHSQIHKKFQLYP